MKKRKQGFTLIELLLVIAILGFLIAMGMASYFSSLQKGRDSKRKSDLQQVSIALESYFADKGTYPLGADGIILGCGVQADSTCAWGAPFTQTFVDGSSPTIYMAQLPQDPTATQTYYYISDGTKYQIYAHLENLKDSAIKAYSGPQCIGVDTNSCNYGVSSTNSNP